MALAATPQCSLRILVDTKYPGYGKAILDHVKSVTGKPITMIINTHTHGDHTGGNTEFPRTVDFVAHVIAASEKAKFPRLYEKYGLTEPEPIEP